MDGLKNELHDGVTLHCRPGHVLHPSQTKYSVRRAKLATSQYPELTGKFKSALSNLIDEMYPMISPHDCKDLPKCQTSYYGFSERLTACLFVQRLSVIKTTNSSVTDSSKISYCKPRDCSHKILQNLFGAFNCYCCLYSFLNISLPKTLQATRRRWFFFI